LYFKKPQANPQLGSASGAAIRLQRKAGRRRCARAPLLFSYPIKTLGLTVLIIFQQFLCVKGKPQKLVQTLQFCTKNGRIGRFLAFGDHRNDG
jgi:hypothetical protein